MAFSEPRDSVEEWTENALDAIYDLGTEEQTDKPKELRKADPIDYEIGDNYMPKPTLMGHQKGKKQIDRMVGEEYAQRLRKIIVEDGQEQALQTARAYDHNLNVEEARGVDTIPEEEIKDAAKNKQKGHWDLMEGRNTKNDEETYRIESDDPEDLSEWR